MRGGVAAGKGAGAGEGVVAFRNTDHNRGRPRGPPQVHLSHRRRCPPNTLLSHSCATLVKLLEGLHHMLCAFRLGVSFRFGKSPSKSQ